MSFFNAIDNRISSLADKYYSAGSGKFSDHILPLTIIFLIVITTQFHSITNMSMPSGDATRVMSYIEFVENSGEALPLWNPYKFAGTPTLADPERFILLAKLISADDKYAYLKFNILLISLIYLIGITCYFLFKQFSISRVGSIAAASIFSTSQLIFNLVKSGRIDGLTSTLLLVTIYLLYSLYARGKKRYLIAPISLFLAIDIYLQGYYALVLLYPFLFLIGLYFNSGNNTRRLITTVRDLTIFTLVGIGVGMIYLLPLIDYTLGLYTSVESLSNLTMSQPLLGSMLNAFIPFFVEYSRSLPFVFSYISLLALPLLAAYSIRRKENPWEYETLFLILFVYGIVFNLGRLFPFSYIVEGFSSLPLIGQIRWANAFWLSVVISVAGFSGAAVDRLRYLLSKSSFNKTGKILFATLAILFAMDILSSLSSLLNGSTKEDFILLSQLWHNPELAIYLIAIMLTPQIFSSIKYRKYLLFLFLILPVLWHRPYSEMPRIHNQTLPSAYSSIFNSDNSYFRSHLKINYTDAAHLQNLNGFSLYFSPEHRKSLSILFGQDITALRPHWVKDVPPLADWNSNAIRYLNLKYVEIKKSKLSTDNLNSWKIAAENGNKVLLAKKDWKPSLKVYDKWIVLSEQEIFNKLQKTELDDSYVMLNEAPDPAQQKANQDNEFLISNVQIVSRTSDKIVFNVNSNKNGVLFIPEYYDRYWRGELNGEPAKILKANSVFRAIPIKKGFNKVRMYYEPTKFYYGAYISLFFTIALILYAIWNLVAKREKEAGTSP